MAQEAWEITGSSPLCARCGGEIKVMEPFFSSLAVSDGQLARRDFCPACWGAGGSADGIAFWRTVRMPKEAPRRRYVKLDLEVVAQIFASMQARPSEGVEGELKYVLALILLRRRRLELVGSGNGELAFMDKEQTRYVLKDPVMGEERVKEVTDRLGELLWEREFAGLGQG
jgi:hypothetical protein